MDMTGDSSVELGQNWGQNSDPVGGPSMNGGQKTAKTEQSFEVVQRKLCAYFHQGLSNTIVAWCQQCYGPN